MNRFMQVCAFVSLAWTLGHPGACLAQDHGQSQDDSKFTLGEVRLSSGPENAQKPSFVFGRPGAASDLGPIRFRSVDPNDSWSGHAVNSFSPIWFSRLNDDVRAHLKLPKDRGLVVARVAPNSPEHEIGIRENDILLALGEVSLASPADLVGALKQLDDKPAPLTLLRNGEKVILQVRSRVQHGLAPVKGEKSIYVIGVTTSPVDPLLRSQLKLPDGQGLNVRHVDEKGPAAKAGLVQGDVLLTLDGKPLDSEQSLYTLVQTEGKKPIKIEVIHEGDRKSISISPSSRTADSVNLIGMAVGESIRTGFPIPPQDTKSITLNFAGKRNVTFTPLPAVTLSGRPGAMMPGMPDGNMMMPGIPGQPGQGPGFPGQPGQGPGFPGQGPGFPGQGPGFPGQGPGFPGQPGQGPGFPGLSKSPDLTVKRLDEMTARIDALRKAVDELAKAVKEKN